MPRRSSQDKCVNLVIVTLDDAFMEGLRDGPTVPSRRKGARVVMVIQTRDEQRSAQSE